MGLFGGSKNKRAKMLELASSYAVQAMDAYLKSKEKHANKLIIFAADDLDNNVNLLCEAIYLMGVYDGLIRCLDNTFSVLSNKDALGFLQAEVVSRDELSGYEAWLRHALTEGEYVLGSYQIKDKKIKPIDILFIAGQLSFTKFFTKEDGLVPDTLGLDHDYDFYDFKEFTELAKRFNQERDSSLN